MAGVIVINLITIGLSDKENAGIKISSNAVKINLLPQTGFSGIQIPKGSSSIILAKIKTRRNFENFQQIYTNYPDNFFICLAANHNRELVSHILSNHSVYILFLPLKISELDKILPRIFREEEVQLTRTQFYKGMQYYKQAFTWKTADVNISYKARLLSGLLKYMNFCKSEQDEVNTRLGIEEILINAIEHGNLELDSRDRLTGINGDDSYEILKKSRFMDARYNQRLIRVGLELKNGYIYISIEDEGPGFDTSKAIAIFEGKTRIPDAEIAQPMGKGFWIIKNLFHSIEFEKNGRKIILGKKILPE